MNTDSTREQIMDALRSLKNKGDVLALSAFIAVISNENGERPEVHEMAEKCRGDFTQDEARRAVEVAQRIRDDDAPSAGPQMVKLCDDTITFIRTNWLKEGGDEA